MELNRTVGVGGAVVLGLGSILGTGVFVSIGIGAGIAGPAVLVAIAIAAVVATCNGLSSAQLAATYSVSGGTYEYAYRLLNAPLGFTAGWMFLCAKSASAATAALGFAGYLVYMLKLRVSIVAIALAAIVVLTVVVLCGLRRSNVVNATIVAITLFALFAFVVFGLPTAMSNAAENFTPLLGGDESRPGVARLLEACALMFVAYTGYGRVATLGEEIHDPKRNIPRAVIATLVISLLVYVAVAFVGVAAAGAPAFASASEGVAAPLEVIATGFGAAGVSLLVGIGAMTAMLGVLLNLLLGLSRVLLAMGRRGDMPAATARIDASGQTPWVAVLVIAALIAGLACIGDVKTTWSFSAFTVLVYYAMTNACALRLPPEHRLYPRPLAWLGLVGCLGLAFWVQPHIWAVGLGLIAAGLLWQRIARRVFARPDHTA